MSDFHGASALETHAVVVFRLNEVLILLSATQSAAPANSVVHGLASMMIRSVCEIINDLETEVL